MQDGTLTSTQRIELTNIMRDLFIDSLKVTSFKVELFSKLYPNGRLVIVFGSPNKKELDKFVSEFKRQLFMDPILVSGEAIIAYVQIIVARGNARTNIITDSQVVEMLKTTLLYHNKDANFIANIVSPFLEYYREGRAIVNDVIDEIKNKGCIYVIYSKNNKRYEYTGYYNTFINIDEGISITFNEHSDKYKSDSYADIIDEEKPDYYMTESELKHRIKYAKHPLERRRLEQELISRNAFSGRHSSTKKKRKRK